MVDLVTGVSGGDVAQCKLKETQAIIISRL